jgi:hypothetical protein
MKNIELKQKLHRYIETAEGKKLKAIYAMVESDIEENEVWTDDVFIAEMNRRTEDLITGKVKGLSWEEVQNDAIKKHRIKQ